jgi:FkbM family methyltransferase
MKELRGWLWRVLLSSRGLRRRLAWQLLHRYAGDLDARVPLGHDLAAPLFDAGLAPAFSEIFLEGEYGPLLDAMPLPRRWVDLGCHAGFFSLWLEWQRRASGAPDPSEILLVDADPALLPAVARLIEVNGSAPRWRALHGAIGSGRACDFIQRGCMASSLAALDASPGAAVRVPVLSDAELCAAAPAPCDLVKVDIEGAEHELLAHYPRLLAATRHLCVEWHSWAGEASQLRALAAERGFKLVCEVQPPRTVHAGRQTGVLLFTNVSADARA